MILFGRFLGLFVLLLGLGVIFGSIYVGLWLCLVGGIVDVLEQGKALKTDSMVVAWAVVRVLFCWTPTVIGCAVGAGMMKFGGMALFHRREPTMGEAFAQALKEGVREAQRRRR